MKLSAEQTSWLNGEDGPSLQWAMEFNQALGDFFDAPHMVPIGSAHFAPDTRMAGAAGKALLHRLVRDEGKTLLMVTHSAEAARAADTLWRIEDHGLVRSGGSAEALP